MEALDQTNNEMMLNVVGENKEDWKDLVEDIDIHTIKLKVKYGRPRPFEITDEIESSTDTDDSPSFPSGHAIEAHALAKILGEEYPDKQAELNKLADKISLSRVQMGSHYPSDIETGKQAGLLIAEAYLKSDVKKSWQETLIKDWVSCASCDDDKEGTEPCGRKDASKGTKRRCRPTCSACKDYKRRGGKSKKRKAGTFSREEDKGLHGWFERRIIWLGKKYCAKGGQCTKTTKKTSSTSKGKKWMKCVSNGKGGYKRVHWGQKGVTVSGKRSGKKKKFIQG